jgi:hypothetical protein
VTLLVCPIGSEDKELLMTTDARPTLEEVLAAFGASAPCPRRVFGDAPELGAACGRVPGGRFHRRPVDADKISVVDVAGFVGRLTLRYQPRTVELRAGPAVRR